MTLFLFPAVLPRMRSLKAALFPCMRSINESARVNTLIGISQLVSKVPDIARDFSKDQKFVSILILNLDVMTDRNHITKLLASMADSEEFSRGIVASCTSLPKHLVALLQDGGNILSLFQGLYRIRDDW